MRFNIIAIGNKMPKWVDAAVSEYSKRFSNPYTLNIHEIPAEKRTKTSNIPRLKEQEGFKIKQALSGKSIAIALDEKGELWSTKMLAKKIENLALKTSEVSFIIGGPDGLSKASLEESQLIWSLSPLTLPHPLVRIILVEQLYRAVSIILRHPYHRS